MSTASRFCKLMQRDLAVVLGCLPHELPLKVFRCPTPLKIGIHNDLLERYLAADPVKLNRWLKLWTKSRRYLEALAQGRARHDLDGNVVGEIDDAHRSHALRLLKSNGGGEVLKSGSGVKEMTT